MKTKKSDLNLNAIGRTVIVMALVMVVVLLIAGAIETASDYDSKIESKMRVKTKSYTEIHYIQNFPEGYTEVQYAIVYGDTLEKIAERNKPEYMSKAEYIEYLMETNNLKDSRIYEGQKIKIMTEGK